MSYALHAVKAICKSFIGSSLYERSLVSVVIVTEQILDNVALKTNSFSRIVISVLQTALFIHTLSCGSVAGIF